MPTTVRLFSTALHMCAFRFLSISEIRVENVSASCRRWRLATPSTATLNGLCAWSVCAAVIQPLAPGPTSYWDLLYFPVFVWLNFLVSWALYTTACVPWCWHCWKHFGEESIATLHLCRGVSAVSDETLAALAPETSCFRSVCSRNSEEACSSLSIILIFPWSCYLQFSLLCPVYSICMRVHLTVVSIIFVIPACCCIYMEIHIYRDANMYAFWQVMGNITMLLSMACEQHTSMHLEEFTQVCMCHVGECVPIGFIALMFVAVRILT